jgi:hypothetical protein
VGSNPVGHFEIFSCDEAKYQPSFRIVDASLKGPIRPGIMERRVTQGIHPQLKQKDEPNIKINIKYIHVHL